MAFLEDPRLRQRWNQISHTTETVTENAAAGIWTFGHTYINPCLGSVAAAIENCTTTCCGDREERVRWRRERERAQGRAEYSFDFYDDWDDEFGIVGDAQAGGGGGGILSSWRSDDWDRLLAGTGRSRRGPVGEIQDQPKSRKRGMSYGTRGVRRKSTEEDPTVIPSTTPIGFLGRLPFKIGGTLRYKPSAATLQEHPGSSRPPLDGENEPLLGGERDEYHPTEQIPVGRKRSGTTGSGETSDSFRSRNDLFPSDEEGEQDAVPLDDEFAVTLHGLDDRSSGTKSSKGKRRDTLPRSVSRTTIDSTRSRNSLASLPITPDVPSLEDLHQEEERIQREEDEEVERKRQAAAHLASERGLRGEDVTVESVAEPKSEMIQVDTVPASDDHATGYAADDEEPEEDRPRPKSSKQSSPRILSQEARAEPPEEDVPKPKSSKQSSPRLSSQGTRTKPPEDDFVPARLPAFR